MRFTVNMIILAILLASGAARSAPTASSDWALYRAPTGRFAFSFPSWLRPQLPRTRVCSNGVCTDVEEVMLTGVETLPEKMQIDSLQFTIQRRVNPQKMAIQRWYESLAHRPLDPKYETMTTVGGRPAIHRGPLVMGTTTKTKRGKIVSQTTGLLPDDTTYVALSAMDVLTISVHCGPGRATECDRVVSTLSFGP